MKRETLLTIAVITLLLLNFGTLGFLLLGRAPHPAGTGPRPLDRKIVETLALDATQKQQFESLKRAHREQMRNSDQAYRAALENYFALLKNDMILPAQQDSLQAILSQIQGERARVTFQHFKDLKALCNAEQQKHFEALLPDLLQVILPPRPNAPAPPQ